MRGYVLDTNVVSELTWAAPDPQVASFLVEQEDLWLSSILIHEVQYRLRLLPRGRRRSRLAAMQSAVLEGYEDRMLPLDRTGAEWAAEIREHARQAGCAIDMGDALVADIAVADGIEVRVGTLTGGSEWFKRRGRISGEEDAAISSPSPWGPS